MIEKRGFEELELHRTANGWFYHCSQFCHWGPNWCPSTSVSSHSASSPACLSVCLMFLCLLRVYWYRFYILFSIDFLLLYNPFQTKAYCVCVRDLVLNTLVLIVYFNFSGNIFQYTVNNPLKCKTVVFTSWFFRCWFTSFGVSDLNLQQRNDLFINLEAITLGLLPYWRTAFSSKKYVSHVVSYVAIENSV